VKKILNEPNYCQNYDPSIPVEVYVSFNGNLVRPIAFRYQGRNVRLRKVNMVHHVKRGQNKIYYFSTSNRQAAYTLSFHTGSLEWRLENIWLEA